MTEQNWMDAQYGVLGSALIEPELVPKVIQQTCSKYYTGPCQTIYTAMVSLFQQGSAVDIITLAHALGGDYKEFLAQLMQITPTAANIDHYIRICRDQSKVQQSKLLASRILAAQSGEEIRKLLDETNSLMVDKPALRITTMADALKSFMTRHTGEVKYLTWPIRELGDHLYADAGDFILIGGYPSSGKSAFSLQCAWHWARDMKVGFFSLETSSEKLFDRQMSSVASVHMADIKRNKISREDWDRICSMNPEITARNLELIPAAGMSPADIRSVTMMRGYKIIIIDYVQLLNSSGYNRTEQVTNISLALHRMAQDMGVTVVALSQLKRKDDESTPENSDLRESGQLEQDADIIMMLKLEQKDKPGGNRYLYATKNKEGECFRTLLAFDGGHQTFSKAQQTGETINKLKAAGRKAQRQHRAPEADPSQMSMLPQNTPIPPQWKDEK